MRWEYVVLLRKRGPTVITFERMELGSRSVGSESHPFTRRLEPKQRDPLVHMRRRTFLGVLAVPSARAMSGSGTQMST